MAKNVCLECKKDYSVKPSRQEKSKFCSYACKGIFQSKNLKGVNNPNFGNNWSLEKKKNQSNIIKSKVDKIYRFKSGSANRGKKFSKERIERMHGHRNIESYSRPHTIETKKKIGQKSKEKFTESYKRNYRQKMENLRLWIPLEEKTDYEIYFKESSWAKSMFSELYHEYKDLIESYGVFDAFKNTKGVVRDHAFSRKSGFDLGVFPEIIRHIENCQIILHSDNVKKNVSKNITSDSLTLEELPDKIQNTKYTEWEEQDICLKKIEDYKNGKRWKRKEAKCVSESK
jgi:hypothetical protein